MISQQVFFPLVPGEYPVIIFVGGLDGIVLVEYYEILLNKLAAHGFVIVGVDPEFPVVPAEYGNCQNSPSSTDTLYAQINFTQNYLVNRTEAVVRWDRLGLLCHSSGCDPTLDLIREQKLKYSATVFLEPYSNHANTPVPPGVPAFMYGTRLSEEGIPCSVAGHDYNQYYSIWRCPRILIKVADFGHCDILDPVPWEVCHVSHFCKTTNNTLLSYYRQGVSGATASFFITYLQGRPDAISYIADEAKVPLKLLIDKSDLNC